MTQISHTMRALYRYKKWTLVAKETKWFYVFKNVLNCIKWQLLCRQK